MPVEYAPRTAPRPRRPPAYAGPEEPDSEGRGPAPRSHAAAYVALALVLVGWVLATWTVLIPGALALLLLSAGVAFLGSRLNPLSIGFYLTTKPSWTAIGLVFLSAVVLLGVAYSYWKTGRGPVVPHQLMP
ncbi:MAG TPA: hypothetical protein VGV89_10230 [Thermoplasmata archaeon]|nr:hypothetical protein [Thermoplasmata archaeon]